jgi:hypothetical protein
VAAVYHRALGGRVTFIDAMTRDEVAAAVERCPWEWAVELQGFAPWPASRARGDPFYPPSLADTAKPSTTAIWNRTP